jgi:hypothetical protein
MQSKVTPTCIGRVFLVRGDISERILPPHSKKFMVQGVTMIFIQVNNRPV